MSIALDSKATTEQPEQLTLPLDMDAPLAAAVEASKGPLGQRLLSADLIGDFGKRFKHRSLHSRNIHLGSPNVSAGCTLLSQSRSSARRTFPLSPRGAS